MLELKTFNATNKMHQLNHTYAIRATYIRRAINRNLEWIEKSLGISLSEAVILETDIAFCDGALPKLVGYVDPYAPFETAILRLTQRVLSVAVPPAHLPIIHLSKERPIDRGQPRFAQEGSDLRPTQWSARMAPCCFIFEISAFQ